MTGIGTQIKNALGWFLAKLKGNVVNNLTSTSTDLPLSAAKGKDLYDQITSLNTKIMIIDVPNGTDLNNLTKNGIYGFNSNQLKNLPLQTKDSSAYGILYVNLYGSFIHQFFIWRAFGLQYIHIRTSWAGEWSEWINLKN